MSSHTSREPQRTGSPRADAEWMADPSLGNLIHDQDNQGSVVDRSDKAAPLPDGDFNDGTTSGGNSAGLKGHTGSGKGPPHPEEEGTKDVEARK